MLTAEDYSRRDDLLMQQVTSVMAAQTDTIKALSMGLDALRTSHDALREKLHSIETMLAENGARERARLDHVIEGQNRLEAHIDKLTARVAVLESVDARVSRLEKVNQVVVGALVSIVASVIIFWFTNVLKTGIGPK